MVMRSQFSAPGSVARVAGMIGITALLSSIAAAPADARQSCSPVMDWNAHALQATVTANQGALPQIRSLAIVHVAMHDALNALQPTYDTYLPVAGAPADASSEAAVIAAAHQALKRLFPLQADDLGLKRSASLASCSCTSSRSWDSFSPSSSPRES